MRFRSSSRGFIGILAAAMCVSMSSGAATPSFAASSAVRDFDAARHFREDKTLRLMNRDELKVAIEARLAENTTEYWLEKMLARGIPCGPINTIDKALADPQVQARGIVVRMGDRNFIGSPIKMSRTPPGLRRGPAEIGEHTRDVLLEAGFTTAEVDVLLAEGAVAQGAAAS